MRSFRHLKLFLSRFLLLAVLMVALTGQLAVEAKPASPSGPGTPVCGSLTSDTTWTVAGSPYLMTCDVVVNTNVTLTIEPGVTVMEDELLFSELEVRGHLAAEGTADNPIIFTSAEDSGPHEWSGLRFFGGTGHLNHTVVRFGGGGGNDGNIYIQTVPANGEVLIENSQITDSGDYAIKINASELHQVRLINNAFERNWRDRILLSGDSIDDDATLPFQTGLEGYRLDSTLTVESDVTLTIEPGVTVMSDLFGELEVKGHLVAEGTAENPIIFTSAEDSGPHEWEGLRFLGGTGHLNHTVVRFAGGLNNGNIYIQTVPPNGEVVIENSQITDSGYYAIQINASELHQVRLINNAFERNMPDRILLSGKLVSNDATLPSQTGLEGYRLDSNLTVESDVTLTVEPGVAVMSSYDELEVKGHLVAAGTADNPVIFTSAEDNGRGQWQGLRFDGGTGLLSHTIVRYGGHLSDVNIDVAAEGEVLLEHSQVLESDYDGLRIQDAQVTVRCTTFNNNGQDAISIISSGSPVLSVSNSEIYNNKGEGIKNENTAQVDARDNYWGHASGPGGEGPGNGEEVSGNVLYDPWLTAPLTECDDGSTPTPTATPTGIPTTNTPTATPTGAVATNTPTATPTGTPATSTPTPTPPSGFGVTAITPNEGMTTETTDVTISGNGFVAGSSVQLRDADGSSHNLLNISRTDATQLLATVPAKLPPGLYDLYVINPDGQSAVLANAFTILATEPSIVEVRPNRGAADLPNEITLYGFSFAIGATVKLDDIELSTTRINGTQLRAIVPADLKVRSYKVIVTNPGGQQVELDNGYTVFDDEGNNDLFGYSYELWLNPSVPRAGEEAEIGLIVHRQGGRNALANVRVRFFRDSQNGTELGDGTIPFLDLPNDEESTVPLNVTFPKAGTFEIVAVIDPDNEVAEDTLGEMNNVISRTVTIGEPAADQTVPVVNDIQINEGALQTTNQNVSVDIRASDPNPNPSGMQAVNIIEYEYNIGANMWVPVQQSNWLPYETTPDTYPWQLMPSAGMRYLQVRAVDNASNISIGDARSLISYDPPSDMVARRQTRVYRYEVAEGEQLEVVVEVISGDPDLYVWSSNEAESARVSNQASGNEQVIVPADQIVPGVYQIEVYGYSEAEYQLEVTVGPATTEAITHRLPSSSGPKPLPSEPIVPVSSVPEGQQGFPPPPMTSTNDYTLYLPAITR